MSGPRIEICDIIDERTFARLPPCADPRFDHRSCDYWEDEVRGSKAARPSWWQGSPAAPAIPRPTASGNPFAPPPREPETFNPFATGSESQGVNPFAPPAPGPRHVASDAPRKLRLLDRGSGIFGSYAKVAMVEGEPGAYAQFGPLSAYPRAQGIRELYPHLPQSPLPAVITCVASTSAARGIGAARALVEAVADDLADRGFAAIEAYPDLNLSPDETSAASPAFWIRCGFSVAADDARYPVMRRELG